MKGGSLTEGLSSHKPKMDVEAAAPKVAKKSQRPKKLGVDGGKKAGKSFTIC